MKKLLFFIIAPVLSLTNIFSQDLGKYEYSDAKDYAEFEKQTFAFWDYVENQIVLLEGKSADENTKDSARFDLGVNSNRWLYNYDNTNKEQTQKQHDFLHSYVNNRLKRIKERTGLVIEPDDLSGFIDYLAGLRSMEEAEKMALQIGIYRPAESADEYLNNLGEFIDKYFDADIQFSIDKMYPYEMHVFTHDFEKFSPKFSDEQKERYELLYNRFGEKDKAWDTKQLFDYRYDYADAENLKEFEQQLPYFWDFVENELTLLEDEELEDAMADSIRYDIVRDYTKWAHRWMTIKEQATQTQRASVDEYVELRLRTIARTVGAENVTGESFHTYLLESLNKEQADLLAISMSKYAPAISANKYLDNLEEFVKSIDINSVHSIYEAFPYELSVLQHDKERFEKEFSRTQKKRYAKLEKEMQKKEMEWNKLDGLRWKDAK